MTAARPPPVTGRAPSRAAQRHGRSRCERDRRDGRPRPWPPPTPVPRPRPRAAVATQPICRSALSGSPRRPRQPRTSRSRDQRAWIPSDSSLGEIAAPVERVSRRTGSAAVRLPRRRRRSTGTCRQHWRPRRGRARRRPRRCSWGASKVCARWSSTTTWEFPSGATRTRPSGRYNVTHRAPSAARATPSASVSGNIAITEVSPAAPSAAIATRTSRWACDSTTITPSRPG